MTQQEFNRRLRRAVDRTAPDDVEAVLSRCETRKGTVIPMTMKKNRTLVRNLIAACLALVLAGGGGGLYYQQANAVASVVSLDVNPSIELKVNRNGKVISCCPLNGDATLVLSDMSGGADLKGTKLDVAVNAIVGALLKNGYLDSISSAILISVEDKDSDRAARLQQELTAAVDGVLQANASNASVLSQTLALDAGLDQQAKTNNISTGKAALVNQVLALNSKLEFEPLANLSVEELKDLIKLGAPAMPIGKAAAQLAAEEYAGTIAVDSITAEVDPELDEQVPHYEVELRWGGAEWEYMVDAWTGQVLSGTPNIPASGSVVTITEERAWEIANQHSITRYPQLEEHNALDRSIQLKKDDGRAEYQVKFSCNGYEFEYEIDAYTGTVLDWEVKENGKAAGGGGQISLGYAVLYISQDEAKQAALDHADVQESQVTNMKVELDQEDGHAVYEVEFKANGTEYEYVIDAGDGAVWKYESEVKGGVSAQAGEDIGESGAKTAALSHAGVKESQTAGMRVKRDHSGGRLEYEVEFWVDSTEYDYTIDGATGGVVEYDVERHPASASGDVGESGARTAALQHAGLSETQVTKLKVERDYDDGRLEYEVEFKSGGVEYEYTIDGATGAVLEHEMDWDD